MWLPPALHLPVFIATVLWIRSCFSSLFLQMKLLTYSDIPLMLLCPEFLLLSLQGLDLWIVPNWNNKTFNSVTMLLLLGTYWHFYNEEMSFYFNLDTFLLGYWSNTIHLLWLIVIVCVIATISLLLTFILWSYWVKTKQSMLYRKCRPLC